VVENLSQPDTIASTDTISHVFQCYDSEILPQKRLSTARSQRYQLWRLQTLLGPSTPLTAITPAVIRGICDTLKEGGAAPATITKYLALISHIYTAAIREWEIIESNPCQRVTRPATPMGRTRYLSPDEVERLLTACQQSRNKRLYLLVLPAVSTGARRGELLNLRRQDIDTSRGLVTFSITKSGYPRVVPLTGRVLELLRVSGLSTPSDLLFPSQNGQQGMWFRQSWLVAVKRAQLDPGATFHTLRHTAASHLAMSGASLLDIATILGHRSTRTTMIYAYLSTSHLSGVLDRMTQTMLNGSH